MPTVKLVSFQGEQVSDLQLSDSVFAAPIHVPAMHQVVVAQLANLRQGTHSCKGRGDVSGGGRKPWRQKHTGRARHGSTRSPIWVGGGVAHGPQPRDYRQKVNKKVRRLAMRSALSLKVRDNLLTVVDKFNLETPSTKEMLGFIDKIGVKKPLIVLHEPNEAISKSVRNIPGARAINVGNINVYDLLNYQSLVLTPEAIARIEEVYSI